MSELPIGPEIDAAPEAEDVDAKLTVKELRFCLAFGDVESPTFGDATQSAKSAGYRDFRNSGWRLRQRPAIIAKLATFHKAVVAERNRILADRENERRLALAKGDIQAAIRASELQGKAVGLFVDVVNLDVAARREYTAAELVEGRRLARLMLEDMTAHPDGVPAADQPPALADVQGNGATMEPLPRPTYDAEKGI